MGLMKDRHGTYGARVKVPDRLHEAVPRVLDRGKDRQSFPMESLGLKTANVRAKPVLAGFDHVFGEAEQFLAERRMRESQCHSSAISGLLAGATDKLRAIVRLARRSHAPVRRGTTVVQQEPAR